MKTILTIIFVLFIGVVAQAQDTTKETVKDSTIVTEKVSETKENSVARLYKFKNAKIKKELNFRTKAHRAKLA